MSTWSDEREREERENGKGRWWCGYEKVLVVRMIMEILCKKEIKKKEFPSFYFRSNVEISDE